jgi:hypothetical protein
LNGGSGVAPPLVDVAEVSRRHPNFAREFAQGSFALLLFEHPDDGILGHKPSVRGKSGHAKAFFFILNVVNPLSMKMVAILLQTGYAGSCGWTPETIKGLSE